MSLGNMYAYKNTYKVNWVPEQVRKVEVGYKDGIRLPPQKKESFHRVLVIACYEYRGSKSQFYAPGQKQEKTVISDELYKNIFSETLLCGNQNALIKETNVK